MSQGLIDVVDRVTLFMVLDDVFDPTHEARYAAVRLACGMDPYRWMADHHGPPSP